MAHIQKHFTDVVKFYNKMNFFIPEDVCPLSHHAASQRIVYLKEETKEINDAKDVFEFVDGIIDLCYIAIGAVVSMGYKSFECGFNPSGKYDHLILESFKSFMTDGLKARPDNIHSMNLLADALTTNPVLSCVILNAAVYERALVVFKAMKLDFDLHWTEVHEANMRKVPATLENPSKRGFTSGDSVKPPGWIGPDHSKFISRKTRMEIMHNSLK